MPNSTEIVTCNSLKKQSSIAHGFVTRNGGASTDIYDSLNLGFHSKDDQQNVKKNYQILVDSFNKQNKTNYSKDNLHVLSQIHSNKAVEVSGKTGEFIEADALVTKDPSVIIGVLTADCVPILLYDPKAKIIGAIHSGWKGAFTGVNENTVDLMVQLGANSDDIIASIGAAIAQESYEVDNNFHEKFIADDDANSQYFIDSKKQKHFMFDLKGYVKGKFKSKGVNEINDINVDSYADESRFYSCRRAFHKNEPDFGRNISLIALK